MVLFEPQQPIQQGFTASTTSTTSTTGLRTTTSQPDAFVRVTFLSFVSI